MVDKALFRGSYGVVSILGVLFLIMVLLNSCDAVFLADLEEDEIIVLSPVDSLHSKSSTLLFWWEFVEDATSYEIQLVQPHFDAISQLVFDSIVTENKLSFSFRPGDYEWRIRAFNEGSSTEWYHQIFTIDTNMDLSLEHLTLRSPSENGASNASSVEFKWDELYNALQYQFRIRKNSEVIVDETLFTTEYIWSHNSEEGNYIWEVKASNEDSFTDWTSRFLQLDMTAPLAVTLNLPVDQDTINTGQISFSWSRPEDNGSQLNDSIVFYDNESMINPHSYAITQQQSVNLDMEAGIWYWRVKSFDIAGNDGEWSESRKLTVENIDTFKSVTK